MSTGGTWPFHEIAAAKRDFKTCDGCEMPGTCRSMRHCAGSPARGAPPADDYEAWYGEAMVASNEAGFVGMDAAETIRRLAHDLREANARLAEHDKCSVCGRPQVVPHEHAQ